jgi:hypothetical protein
LEQVEPEEREFQAQMEIMVHPEARVILEQNCMPMVAIKVREALQPLEPVPEAAVF